MAIISLLIRLIFFVAGSILLSLLVLALVGLAAIVWYGVFFPLWIILGLPAAIFYSVFRNPYLLSGYSELTVEFFLILPVGLFISIADSHMDRVSWLLGGCDRKSVYIRNNPAV